MAKTCAQWHRIQQTAIRYKDLFFLFLFFVALFRTVTAIDVNIINLNLRLLPFLWINDKEFALWLKAFAVSWVFIFVCVGFIFIPYNEYFEFKHAEKFSEVIFIFSSCWKNHCLWEASKYEGDRYVQHDL